MKVRPPKPFKTSADLKKSASIDAALRKKSETEVVRPERFEVRAPVTKVKLNLNVSGNRRGMNVAENPPSSEQMRLRRAMRKLWNKKMPVLNCSNCQFSAQCPQFKAGYVCAFEPFMQSHTIEGEEDLLFYAKELLQENIKRAQLTLIMEKLTGGKPSLETSEALAYLFQQLMQLHERMGEMNRVSIEVESEDKSIVGRLFGGLDKLLAGTKASREDSVDNVEFSGETKLIEATTTPLPVKSGHRVNEDLVRDLALSRDAEKPKPEPEKVRVPAQQPTITVETL